MLAQYSMSGSSQAKAKLIGVRAMIRKTLDKVLALKTFAKSWLFSVLILEILELWQPYPLSIRARENKK